MLSSMNAIMMMLLIHMNACSSYASAPICSIYIYAYMDAVIKHIVIINAHNIIRIIAFASFLFLKQKIFVSQKILCHKKIFVEKNFVTKNFVAKNFASQKFCCKKFCYKNFYSYSYMR